MAAHRYWRARGLLAYDGGVSVDLSEFWLLSAGARVDTSATLTSSVAPTVGSLSSLSDNDTATGCTLSTASVLTWDFGGSPADVDDIRLGSADAFGKFLRFCLIEWSDDAASWTDYAFGDPAQRPHSFGWPGVRTLTTTYDPDTWEMATAANLTLDPSDDRTVTSPNASHYARGVSYASSGVRQFEIERAGTPAFDGIGVWRIEDSTIDTTSEGGWVIRPGGTGTKSYNNGAYTAYATGGRTDSDIFGVVVDFGAGTLTVYKNGVSLGAAFTNLADAVVRPGIVASSGIETIKLLTNGFTYPIAGAEPWTRATIAQGAPTVGIDAGKISNGGHELAYSGAIYVPNHRARSDFNFDPAARGRIVGTVKRKSDPSNIPLKRRVRLYRDRDGMLIRETWSDDSGNYQFDYIEEGEPHTVISHDYQHNYRAVAADNLTLANGGITLIAP